jgi:hypothetical protein
MKRYNLTLTLFTLTASLFAQDQPVKIKGHFLGQSITEFAEMIAPGTEKACRESTTPKIARQKKVDFKWCSQQFLPAIDSGRDFLMGTGDHLLEGMFVGGKMVRLKITTVDEYPDLLIDMKSRFGEPSFTDDKVTQNGYGATFHNLRAIWMRPKVVASLVQHTEFGSHAGYYKTVDITIQTPELANGEPHVDLLQ